ncbi:hypothetical protein BS78_08G161900 [Paspalum vaginatum]|nr:hypothetical protein BS78_08G161900 [Paspalum vaginatum]
MAAKVALQQLVLLAATITLVDMSSTTMGSSSMDCPSSIYDHTVNSKGAIKFPVFHRNHPCLRMTSAKQNIEHQHVEAAERSIDVIQDRSINPSLFLMPINLGTPPVMNLVAIDTGSSLSWVQCQPCKPSCHHQDAKAGQIFDPSDSRTYRTARCVSAECSVIKHDLMLQTGNCMGKEDACLYLVTYGARVHYTVGKVAWDNLIIGSGTTTTKEDDDTRFSFSFLFGCSLAVHYPLYEAGIIGFGTGTMSFFEQVSRQSRLINYKAFRYCFPSDEATEGYMILGDYNRQGVDGYTPLFPSGIMTRTYSLTMEGLVANGQVIVVAPSDMVVDSGSTMTFLAQHTIRRLDKVMTEAMASMLGYQRSYTSDPNRLCFISEADSLNWKGKHTVFTNWSGLPTVEMAFSGAAALAFPPKNLFYNDRVLGLCMTFGHEPRIPVQVLGNVATRSFETIFDIQGKLFGFRYSAC